MKHIQRTVKEKLTPILKRKKSVLLLGPQQTGKTTLINEYKADLEIPLSISKTRRQYKADPDQLIREVQSLQKKDSLPLVVIDEIRESPSPHGRRAIFD